MGRQCRRTEAARLAWHGPERHWQSSWWVAWPSLCMCAGKGWTLWATVVMLSAGLCVT